MSTSVDALTPVDFYLRAQQELTAVERFAREAEGRTGSSSPGWYRSLLPATPPREGEQYAFEVDLDRCSGCKACVTACHALNGLDDDEAWRDVGLLLGGSDEDPLLQHVTTACHHCIEPACAIACPVDAYEKDPVTGIVMHLDDQCFGCQYCTLACPYDVPKYHRKKGIVRKCDMCSQRLAVGEAPACVQACPHEAIAITVVSRERIIRDSEANQFLPGAPEPQHTLPTTNYKTTRTLPRNLLPADYFSVKPEHAHWPLVVMLVLTQLSVGAFAVELALELFGRRATPAGFQVVHAASALAFGLLALAASIFHLGRPFYAFRALIGLRHSWLSREILAFGLFAPLAAAYAVWLWKTDPAEPRGSAIGIGLGLAVVIAGLAGVFSSVMVYATTRRVFWHGPATTARFTLTMFLLGTATALVTSTLMAAGGNGPPPQSFAREAGLLARLLIFAMGAKLLFESLVFLRLRDRQQTPLKRTALLMTGELVRCTGGRFACGLLGGVVLPGVLAAGSKSPSSGVALAVIAVMIFVLVLTGELLERYLFFTAVVRRKMPGGLAP